MIWRGTVRRALGVSHTPLRGSMTLHTAVGFRLTYVCSLYVRLPLPTGSRVEACRLACRNALSQHPSVVRQLQMVVFMLHKPRLRSAPDYIGGKLRGPTKLGLQVAE